MTAPLGERVLDWMLRRLHQAVRLEHDLVLVHDCPALVDVGPSIDVRGEPWRVARVTGELTLRDALPEADRLLAIVPASFPPLPMDIAGRTYLRRILDVRAEDVVAGASGRFCEALVDEGLTQAVFDSLEHLRDTAGAWSLGDLVTAREVRSVLVGAELGAARLDRERDWELLARWVREGAPTFRAPTLVRSALEEAQPRSGAWLGWALTDGSLELLCTVGALLASAEGESRAPTIPGLAASDRGQLVELVDAALREVWRTAPGRAREVLSEAERIARQAELDASRHRLLRVPLEGALSRAANLAAQGHPPDDVEIEGLKRNLHAGELADTIRVVGDLARLARFQGLPIPADTKPAVEWFGHALRDVAWADMAFRRVRRAVETIPPWLADTAQRVISTWLTRRDLLNQRFAESLAGAWPVLARNSDMRHPLALHQLTRCVVRRLVDDGQRVFLVVLDGCDVASFLEILESLPPEERVGLVLPDVHDAVLRDDLTATGALAVAISPLPTVTSHSRRALFAGEIPGNTALDDTESAAANATADHRAWSRNTALGDLPRRLFLKGDLGPAGQPLLDALRTNDSRVVAAVFNGVDDALSSKQTTALPRWSLGNLGAGAAEAIRAAVDAGWCIIVTADHGHTPFVTQERKAGSGGLGHRFSAEACSGSVEFRSGPLPRQPLHLLVGFGAWLGTQHRGFHGGAGLEEVAVPLAFLGRVRGEQEGRPRAPSWWWSVDGDVPPEQRPQAALRPQPQPHPAHAPQGVAAREVKLDPRLDTLAPEERLVVALLQKNESVRLSLIARHLNKSPMRASGFMQQLVRKLFEIRYPCITAEVLPDNDRLYRYEPVDRGTE
ncbi:MAG: BREX-2 system phosphatase PglZ [Polyangiaceae bacterium]